MKRKWGILILCILCLFIGCKPAAAPITTEKETNIQGVDPVEGTFTGKTDQGEDFTLWVDNLNGTLTVTRILYNSKLTGSGWSVTVTRYQGVDCNFIIQAGQFMGFITEHNSNIEINGVFTTPSTVLGRLRETLTHEQVEYGTAVADITFEAELTH